MNHRSTAKKCSKCKQIKSITEFSKRTSCKDQLHYQCKDCCNYYSASYYQANRTTLMSKAKLNRVKRNNSATNQQPTSL